MIGYFLSSCTTWQLNCHPLCFEDRVCLSDNKLLWYKPRKRAPGNVLIWIETWLRQKFFAELCGRSGRRVCDGWIEARERDATKAKEERKEKSFSPWKEASALKDIPESRREALCIRMYQRRTLSHQPVMGEYRGLTRNSLEETRHRTEAGLKIFTSHSRVGRPPPPPEICNLAYLPAWVAGTRKEVWPGRGREARRREKGREKNARGLCSLKKVANHLPSGRPASGRNDPRRVYVCFSKEVKSTDNETRRLGKGKKWKIVALLKDTLDTRLPGSHPSPSPLQSFSLFLVLLLEASEAVFGNFFSGSYQKNEKADRMKESTMHL